MAEYISREAAIKRFNFAVLDCLGMEPTIRAGDIIKALESIPTADVRPVPEGGIGEMSDGYHTFNGLYYQRMVLFAALVKVYKGMAWKSWRHEDGDLCFGKDNYFIVGIDTPKGSYTYHYHGEHWDLFDCEELPVAKHWDGHTEKDVTRLLSLPDVRPVVRGHKITHNRPIAGYWASGKLDGGLDGMEGRVWVEPIMDNPVDYCSECGKRLDDTFQNFCPNCGADMRETNNEEA